MKRAVARFFESIPHPGKEPTLWLTLILLLAWKYTFTAATGTNGFHDGSYYMDLAQNIRDGVGFRTDLSLYHQGMLHFPHPTPVYPIWPLVLGYMGRILPLHYVVHWLPFWLYIFTLLMAFSFAKSVWPVRFFKLWRIRFHAGHVLVLLLGLHRPFFIFTSQPYTEGLTYFLLFIALFRARHFYERANLWRGIEMGLWGGLLLLTRSQALLFTIAMVVVMPLGFLCHKWRRYLLACLGFAAGFIAMLVPFHLYLAQFMDPAPWLMMRFDKYVASPGLSTFSIMIQSDNLVEIIQDRAKGFWIAFNWWGSYSYGRTFHHFQYGLLLAAPLWLFAGVRILAQGSWHKLWVWLGDRERQYKLFLVILAIGGFTSIHMLHKQYFAEWNFSTRHGITCGFLFFIALLYLARYSRVSRWLALLCIFASIIQGHYIIYKLTDREITARSKNPLNVKLARYINEGTTSAERTVFVKGYPQSLAPFTPNAAYHWVFEDSTLKDLRVLFDKMGAHFLLLNGTSKKYTFFQDKEEFDRYFELFIDKFVGHDVYIRRRKEPPVWYGPLW